MAFEKGNQYGKRSSGGKKGRSGRKKSLKTVMNEALERIDEALPNLIDSHIQEGVLWFSVRCPECSHKFEIPGGGDKGAREYLMDRALGKAKIFSEIDLHEDGISGGDMVEVLKVLGRMDREMDADIKGVIDSYFQEHPELEQPEWYLHLHARMAIATATVFNPGGYSLKEGIVEGEVVEHKEESSVVNIANKVSPVQARPGQASQ